jgi:hypothetical protein
MKARFIEHILSIVVITAILLSLLFWVGREKEDPSLALSADVEALLNLPFIEFDRSFDKSLLLDVLDLFEPGKQAEHELLLAQIEQFRRDNLVRNMELAHIREGLSLNKLKQLAWMYLKFILIYALVMLLTYYGVQTFGLIRFVRKQQKRTSDLLSFFRLLINKPEGKRLSDIFRHYGRALSNLLIAVIKAAAFLILFSPAYVIAYSLKTEFNTDSILFMIILAVLSNGLLILYTHKFYTFLLTESRKGYVQTALVKNLEHSYLPSPGSAVSYKNLFQFRKHFDGHILNHIFMNARFQYLSTVKEQASFLITGLIIIEMALNIHGHLNYEMLKQILYRNYDIVLVIILGIFYVVKGTEIISDLIIHKETLKYENQ